MLQSHCVSNSHRKLVVRRNRRFGFNLFHRLYRYWIISEFKVTRGLTCCPHNLSASFLFGFATLLPIGCWSFKETFDIFEMSFISVFVQIWVNPFYHVISCSINIMFPARRCGNGSFILLLLWTCFDLLWSLCTEWEQKVALKEHRFLKASCWKFLP